MSARTAVRIALVGDSTVTDRSGWGKAFADRFNEAVEVLNFAVGGRSSKSWYEEGRLPEALEAKADFALIQFGHNDQPGKGPDRETDPQLSFRSFLRLYIAEFRAVATRPILLSSVVRRHFDERGAIRSSLEPWATAAAAVAREQGVGFIDLHALSASHHERIGPEASSSYNPTEDDATHFNRVGAEAIAELIVGEMSVVAGELTAFLK